MGRSIELAYRPPVGIPESGSARASTGTRYARAAIRPMAKHLAKEAGWSGKGALAVCQESQK